MSQMTKQEALSVLDVIACPIYADERENFRHLRAFLAALPDVPPRALTAGPHSLSAIFSGDGALNGGTGGIPGAHMCVRAYGHRVSVVDVRQQATVYRR